MKRAATTMVRLGLGGLILRATIAGAAPPLIHDSGTTEPLAPYLEAVQTAEPAPARAAEPELPLPNAPLSQLLPVHSPSLKPCALASINVSRAALGHLKMAFFALGADGVSVAWLERNLAKLQALRAVGLVVEAETESDVNRVRLAAPGLLVVPTSGETLETALGLACYPVLITTEGVYQ